MAKAKKRAAPKKNAAAKKRARYKEMRGVVKTGLAPITEAEVIEAFDLLGITAQLTDPAVKRLFVKMAVMNQLNPLKREIHAVERKKKVTTFVQGKGEVTEYVKVLSPVTGYEVFIDRAELSGRLQYWYPVEEGKLDLTDEKKDTYGVTVVIKRRDWPKEFRWSVKHSEVSADNPMWQKEPTHMTMKVAISRAFRLCFREVLRGMPFTVEEEYTREEERDVIPMKEPQAKQLEAPKTVAQVAAEDAERKRIAELKAAQDEVQTVYTRCVDSKLYDTKTELPKMMALAVECKEKVESLRDLAVAWQIDLAERAEKKAKGAAK